MEKKPFVLVLLPPYGPHTYADEYHGDHRQDPEVEDYAGHVLSDQGAAERIGEVG